MHRPDGEVVDLGVRVRGVALVRRVRGAPDDRVRSDDGARVRGRPVVLADVDAVGQEDGSPAAARATVGAGAIVGRSTHAPDQCDAADADPEVDYLAVGPVHATPTKPGRPAAGLDYVSYAAAHADKPWFAIGGLDAGNLAEVTARGATRVVVVRAITESDDPESAAAALRAALEGRRGQAQP